jgi:hypothetical protein
MFKVQRIINLDAEKIEKILNAEYKNGYEFLYFNDYLLFFKKIKKTLTKEDKKLLSKLDEM